jgi:O-antigen/teichoic acid export membrane protein
LPIAFVDFTVLGFGFIDILLLGFFVPSEAVAVYFAATRILQFVAFVQYAASAATAQRFAEAHAKDDRIALSALAAKTARLTAIGTTAVGVGVIAASPLLFALFGPGFGASIPILAVLIVGLVAQSACGPGEDLLNMLGAERTCALVSLAAVAGAIALNLALIPSFGTLGAAVAMALAGVGRSLALAVAARRRLGVTSHIFASAAA